MDPTDFRLVAALAAEGSFAGAARRLDMAHTTVARRLRQMEGYYGTRLFESGPDGMVPTAAGERVLATARQVMQELEGLERSIRNEDQQLTGPVRLTTVDVLAWHFMNTIALFRSHYPQIELSIDIGTELRSLSRRDAEMALRLTNTPDEYLFGRKLMRFDFKPYAHRRLVEAWRGREFAALDWIDYAGRDCAGPATRWMRERLPTARPLTSVTTPLTMLRAVSQGLGAGLLPEAVAETQPELTLLEPATSFSMDVWLLAPLELRSTARIRAVFEAFAGHMPRPAG